MTCGVSDCGAACAGFMCRPCLGELDRAIGDWASLLTEVQAAAARQTYVHRAAGPDTANGDDLAQLDEEYAWRLARIPSHLRSGNGRLTLPSTEAMVNLAASDLYDAADNLLGTWARHLSETRKVELDLQPRQMLDGGKVADHAPIEGPACAPHVHDFRTAGCGLDPDSCKQLHPGHVHEMHSKGCAYRRDSHTGESLPCPIPHLCSHPTCALIRNGSSATQAVMVAGWLLEKIDWFRWDEAGPDAHREITAMHRRMTRAVDRSASRTYQGPCDADLDHGRRCSEPLYAWPWKRRDDGSIDPEDTVVCDGYRPPFERHDPNDPAPPPDPDPCGTIHTAGEREEWFEQWLDETLLTIDEIIEIAPGHLPKDCPVPPRGVIRSWVTNNRMPILGRNAAGDPVFKGGTALALIRAYRPKTWAPRPNRRRMSA